MNRIPEVIRHLVSTNSFLRFLMVGTSNFVISFTVFRLLLLAPVSSPLKIYACQLISFASGIVWSYFLNRRFTFRCEQPIGPQATRFVSLQVTFALLSSLSIGLLVNNLGVNPSLAWFGVMALVTIANYFLCRFWVYR